MEVEKALTELGKYSRWQLERSTSMCIFCYMAVAFHSFTIVFIGWTPPHHCKVPSYIATNITWNHTRTSATPTGTTSSDECHILLSNNDKIGCKYGQVYDANGYTSIVTEFDLVCDRSHLPALSQSVYYGGVLTGSLIFPIISDMFGRKPTAIVTMCLTGIAALCMVSAKSIIPFIITRFFVGTFMQGSVISQYTLNAELFPSKQRAFATCYMYIFWSVWMTLFALVGYLLMDWRHIAVVIGCVSFLSLAGICLMKESIPWLVANGKGKEAVALLRIAAKRNGSEFSEGALDDVRKTAARAKFIGDQTDDVMTQRSFLGALRNRFSAIRGTIKQHLPTQKTKLGDADVGVMEIMRHRKLRLWTILVVLMWMSTNITYYGLTLSSTAFVGNRFLNFFLSGVVEFPAYLFMMFILGKIGRRYSVLLSYFCTAVFLIASNVIPKQANGVNLVPLIMTLNAIGKFFISTAYGVLYVLTSELYPTNFRARGMGITSIFARFGAMLSPFCEVLARYSPVALGLALGAVSIMNGILVLPLPETNNQPMPETMEDIDNLARKSTTFKNCFRINIESQNATKRPVSANVSGDDITTETPML
ncbi:organic cation transporter protein-like [Tubulanus polymorphus]|uniref:organic cation transporter protein-like n=1 Tax=Tubulanus polymorphus TaxID=672921 RepID=UPI003DA1DBE9